MWSGSDGLETRLGDLMDDIFDRQPDVLLAVSSIIPWQAHASRIATYNQNIPGIVQERVDMGFNVIFVDQFSGFPTTELADGVHPNSAGYKRMGGKWYSAIESYLN